MPIDPALLRAYTALAAAYDAQRDQFDLSAVLDDFLARLPPGPGVLLDLGCGAGVPVARTFLARGWRVTGVDACPAMLALAARQVPGMTRIETDLRDLDWPAASADAIAAIYSLFHLPAADHPAVFARWRHWLRPGGLALFTYATRAYTGADRFDGTKTFMGQSLYYSHATPEELAAQLTAAGLAIEDWRDRTIGGETFLWVTARHDDRART